MIQEVLLTSSGGRPGMQLNLLPCPASFPAKDRELQPKARGAELEGAQEGQGLETTRRS